MLCLQQCIDLCNLSPEDAAAGRPREGLPGCQIRDIRDELLAEVEAAQDFDDLDHVMQRYVAYLEDRDGEGAASR